MAARRARAGAAARGGGADRGAARALSPLRPPGDLAGFPAHLHGRTRLLWRIHRRGQSPWWFSSDGRGRFDLPPPRGTCYAAEHPLAAFVEVFRDARVLPQDEIGARALALLRPPRRLRLADTTVPEARRYGITLEIAATPRYEDTQPWALALADAGFDGIRYRVRHDPSGALLAVALFGAAGLADNPWESRPIDDDLLSEAQRRFGIAVLRKPLA